MKQYTLPTMLVVFGLVSLIPAFNSLIRNVDVWISVCLFIISFGFVGLGLFFVWTKQRD